MTERSYFERRIYDEVGATPEQCKYPLQWGNQHEPKEREIVFADEEGNICFLVYDLDGWIITYDAGGDPSTPKYKSRVKDFVVKRLKEPKMTVNKKGKLKEQRYDIPHAVGTRPFLPPNIVEKFKRKEPIETLTLTEGYIKAYCGFVNGFDMIGLISITTYKDKKTQMLHPDILRVIETCAVKNIVLLYDGDAQRISLNELNEGTDISMRPMGFFNSACNIRELLKDYMGAFECDLYYAQVLSENVKGEPKGFDDLVMTFKNQFAGTPEMDDGHHHQQLNPSWAGADAVEILKKDLFSFSKQGNYFKKFNIRQGVNSLRTWMHITGANDFYGFHQQLLKDKEFIFLGTRYRWNEEKQDCEVIIPAAAKNYFRSGTRYYRKVEIPDKYGNIEHTFHQWDKSTVKDDHGANFINHIPKYVAFCNVPDHQNYQSIMHNCYNVYFPFEHEPEEGDCPKTLEFLKHIFGEQYELGLDYIQLLYQRPTQILPILCLVSRQNNTGKSTFAKWLRAIFTQNMTVVGNAELQNDFNASWATKLLICCEESFIDKKVVVEKIKALATADKILMNAKGKDHVEINFFGKFLFLSNNEENFIYAGEEDIRYWVRKIPMPATDNVKLLDHMVGEIGCFLNFLSKRVMSTECRSRMWFTAKELETEALKKVRMASRPTLEKELRMKLREYFLDFGEEMLLITLPALKSEFFRNKYEDNFLRRILQDNLKVDQYYLLEAKDGQRYEPWALPDGMKAEDCQRKFCTKRSSYMKKEYSVNGTEQTRQYMTLTVSENGKPYVFQRNHFVSENDLAMHILEQEVEVGNSAKNNGGDTTSQKPVSEGQRKIFNAMTREGRKELPPEPEPPDPDLPF